MNKTANWQVSGYEDAKKQFGTWDDDDPKWKNYMGLAKKMVIDSNAVAQEKGEEYVLSISSSSIQVGDG